MDYEADPNPDQILWAHQRHGKGFGPLAAKNPLLTNAQSVLLHPSSDLHPVPDVHIEDLPGLDCPPLSPATLNLLSTCLQLSPTFDSPWIIPLSTPLNAPSCTHSQPGPSSHPKPAISGATLTPCNSNPNTPIRSECFSSTIPHPKSTPSTPHTVNQSCRSLLKEHPTGRRMNKSSKRRCLKAVDKDINLTLGGDISMAKVANTAKKVLVGRV